MSTTTSTSTTITTATTKTTTITTTTTTPVYDLNLVEVWRTYELGRGVGIAGMISADFDNDGWKEIVVSSNRGTSISVLRFDGNSSYRILQELDIGRGLFLKKIY